MKGFSFSTKFFIIGICLPLSSTFEKMTFLGSLFPRLLLRTHTCNTCHLFPCAFSPTVQANILLSFFHISCWKEGWQHLPFKKCSLSLALINCCRCTNSKWCSPSKQQWHMNWHTLVVDVAWLGNWDWEGMSLFVFYFESNCNLQTMEVLVNHLGIFFVRYGLPLPSDICGFLSFKSSMY